MVMDIQKIQEILPHRFPFLLIDRVLELKEGPDPTKRLGRSAKVIKNVTMNEHYFAGHFPQQAVMPGVLQIEAMAQASAVACVLPGDQKLNVVIASISDAKFRKIVVPGDQLEITAEITRERGLMFSARAVCYVDGQKVSEVDLMARVFLEAHEEGK